MRVAMLSGSRVSVLTAPDDALLLRPPRPQEAIGDVGAAVRDALRFPLSGTAARGARDTGRHGHARRRAPGAAAPRRSDRPPSGGTRGHDRRARAAGRPVPAPDDPRRRGADAPGREPRARGPARPDGRPRVPRPGRGARRRVRRPPHRGRGGPHGVARPSTARPDRPRPHRHGGRDGAARRRRRSRRRLRRPGRAGRGRVLAARDGRVAGLAGRGRPRTCTGRPCPGPRHLARAQPAAAHGASAWLPPRRRGDRDARQVARATSGRCCPAACAAGSCRASPAR